MAQALACPHKGQWAADNLVSALLGAGWLIMCKLRPVLSLQALDRRFDLLTPVVQQRLGVAAGLCQTFEHQITRCHVSHAGV